MSKQLETGSLATKINEAHEAAQRHARQAVGHAARCGEMLLEAKSRVAHGEWLPWIRENCRFSERTARGYMRLARELPALEDEKRQRVADLPLRDALVYLAEPRREAQTAEDVGPIPSKGSDFATIWEWAVRQVAAPINAFDMEDLAGLRSKVLDQIGISEEISFMLCHHSQEFPLLRLATSDDLVTTLERLADLVHEKASLRVDPAVAVKLDTWVRVKATAQRDFALVWVELTEARKKYVGENGHDLWISDTRRLLDDYIASLDRQIEAGGEAAS